MSLSTESGGCAYRLRRRTDERGFFLVEVLVLSFLLLACSSFALVYRSLSRNRVETAMAITAAYLAQEQFALIEAQPSSYIHKPGALSMTKNDTRFEMLSSLSPHAASTDLMEAEVRVRWQANGHEREASYRKLVTYHE